MSVIIKRTTFSTDDQVSLQGRWYLPEAPRKVVVISGATGVPEGFYRRFATWLAREQGFACLTYTYRDMGDTSPDAMKKSQASIQDWTITDGQAARDAARAAWPDLPLWVIGHSLGGMMLSKQPRISGIDRVITIGSGLVCHKEHPMPFRLMVYLLWFVVGPITVWLLGYLPGKSIGFGSTLPARVFWRWRRWCTSGPDGFLADPGLPPSDWSSSRAPVRIVAISDDLICPPHVAFSLARTFEGATIDQLEIDGTRAEGGKLGHFGIFTEAGRMFWPELIETPALEETG